MLDPFSLDRTMTHLTGQTTARGTALLADPLLNNGTAFTPEERAELGLDGLLPPATEAELRQAVEETPWIPDYPAQWVPDSPAC